MNSGITDILSYLPARISSALSKTGAELLSDIREIRMKRDSPLLLYGSSELFSLNTGGNAVSVGKGIWVYNEDITFTYGKLTGDSVYAYLDELSNCYITAAGGHRAGITGTAVIRHGEIAGIRDVSGIYFRIAAEHIGCSDEIMSVISGNSGVFGTVIAAPPGKGKTTILRDAARRFSSDGKKVCIIDERREIAGTYGGRPSFTLGFCDILDGFPKASGIERAVRVLSPDIVIFDEIGNVREAEACAQAMNSGCAFLTSVHAGSAAEALKRTCLKKLADENALDIVIHTEFGKIKEVCYLKGHGYVENSSFELDLRGVRGSGNN